MMDIQRILLQWLINFFYKKSSVATAKNKNMSNHELVEEWHKPNIRKIKKQKVYSYDMQLLSNLNKEIRLLLCVIGIYRKYA